jgi:hypothetical protein
VKGRRKRIMNDIFRELNKGVDFDYGHNDAYTVVSQMLVEWCESRGRCFSDLIIKIKVGDNKDIVFESFDSNNYCFVSDYDWWEGENTIQILDIKRLEDVFDDAHDKTFGITDAFAHLISGKKVRQKTWDKDKYIELINDTVSDVIYLVDENDEYYPAENLFGKLLVEGEWEDYEEE